MKLYNKIFSLLSLLIKGELQKILIILSEKYKLSFLTTKKYKWSKNINLEIKFWDQVLSENCFKNNNGKSISPRLDPHLQLQERPAKLLPKKNEVKILDVGSGPLTALGKVYKNTLINIVAVDPLANEYNKILSKYKITPIIKTQKADGEYLTKIFSKCSFDLVCARNSLDHSYNPEKAIIEMLQIVKNDSYVLLEHRINEGINQNYRGLHQWNFSLTDSGDFIIESRYRKVNMSKKYSNICSIKSSIVDDGVDGKWLTTEILKK